MDNQNEEILKQFIKQILSLFNLENLNYSLNKGEEETTRLDLPQNEDSGFLIGYHGKTLEAIQFLLMLMVFYKTGEWQRVSVEIGDYKKKKEEYLQTLAEKVAGKAAFLNEPIPLSPMSAAERRILHLYLQNRDDVYTESEGEGGDRHIVVYPQKKEAEVSDDKKTEPVTHPATP